MNSRREIALATPMPDLSVVLIVDRRRERGARCLRALLDQSAIDRLEILVFDFATAACPPLDGSDHPSVSAIPVQHPSSLGAVRLQAFQQADGPWVAFVEEHALVLPGWAEALLARIQNGEWAGIGGEMRNLRPGSRAGEAFYLMNFGRFSAPAQGGPSALLVGNNAAYRRESVLSLGDALPDLLELEPLLCWRLAERGYVLGVEPAARMLHANEPNVMAFVEANFVFSRLFGALRGDAQGWSWPTRLLWAFSAPVLPVIRMARLLRFTATSRPTVMATVLWSLPALVFSQYVAALGQSLGLLAGEGRTRSEFLILDLDAPRDEPPA